MDQTAYACIKEVIFLNKHGKKMVAPIIIAILFVVYYLGIAALFLFINGIPMWGKILLVIIPLALAGVMIGVVKSRINEIRSGEEDDLGKY